MSNFITKFFPRFSASPTQPDLRQSQGRFSVGKEEYAGLWEGPVNRSKAIPIKNDVLTFLSSQDLLSWIMTHMYYKEGEEKKYINDCNDCAEDIVNLLIKHHCKDQAYHAVEIIEKLESNPNIKGKKELLLALKEKLRGVEDSVSIVQLILEKRPSPILLSFIEDILPEKKKAVFTTVISRSTFFSRPTFTRFTKNSSFTPDNTRRWDASLKKFRKEFGDKSDLILALGWLACFFCFRELSKKRLGLDYTQLFISFLKLEPEKVAQAIQMSKVWQEKVYPNFKAENGETYREYLFPYLIKTPTEYFYLTQIFSDTEMIPSSIWEDKDLVRVHDKLRKIFKFFKENGGLESFFVDFFNINYCPPDYHKIESPTFFALGQFFNDSINQDIGKENNEKLKALHKKRSEDQKWNGQEWQEYRTAISYQKDSSIVEKWASTCCFLYYFSHHNRFYAEHFDEDGSFRESEIDPYCLSMRDPSYWEDLAHHAPDLAHKILDIMKRSCGDRKEKQEDAAGIPEALLALNTHF